METMEQTLARLLGDPSTLERLQAMAQSLGLQPQEHSENAPKPAPDSLPAPDPQMLQKLSGLMAGASIDSREQSLLQALGNYLSPQRIARLERAMKAAKLARTATTVFGESR